MSYLDYLKRHHPPRPEPRRPAADCLHDYQRIDDHESRCIYCGDIRDDR